MVFLVDRSVIKREVRITTKDTAAKMHPLHPHHEVFEEDLVEGEGEAETEEEESVSVLIAGGEGDSYSSTSEKISWKFKLQPLVSETLKLRLRNNWFMLLLLVIIASLVVVIVIQRVVGTGGGRGHSSKPPPPPKGGGPPNKHHPYPSYHQHPQRPPFKIEICLQNQQECWTPRGRVHSILFPDVFFLPFFLSFISSLTFLLISFPS
jgi:hypothetical protein